MWGEKSRSPARIGCNCWVPWGPRPCRGPSTLPWLGHELVVPIRTAGPWQLGFYFLHVASAPLSDFSSIQFLHLCFCCLLYHLSFPLSISERLEKSFFKYFNHSLIAYCVQLFFSLPKHPRAHLWKAEPGPELKTLTPGSVDFPPRTPQCCLLVSISPSARFRMRLNQGILPWGPEAEERFFNGLHGKRFSAPSHRQHSVVRIYVNFPGKQFLWHLK